MKTKYYVIEPYYMEGTPPDGPVVFSGSLYSISAWLNWHILVIYNIILGR